MAEHRLSNIELYYSKPEDILNNIITLSGEEYKHSVKVMRNKIGDVIHTTDGTGRLFKTKIISINPKQLKTKIVDTNLYENELANVYFCLPKLKKPDRFKFALEKCVELGVTNFIVFEPERSIAKGTNLTRWEKLTLSAMKQSLRTHLPKIQIIKRLDNISKLPGKKIVFDQNSNNNFNFDISKKTSYYFIFGPEGGLTPDELSNFNAESIYTLSNYRLRSETAIIKVASLLK